MDEMNNNLNTTQGNDIINENAQEIASEDTGKKSNAVFGAFKRP